MPWRAFLFPFLTLLTLSFGCDRPTEPVAPAATGAPNVLLLSIDTLRPDHLGSYGYDRPTSPELDRLAAQGIVFEDASTPAPWTLPAHASMLTGRYPSRHGLNSNRRRLPATIPTLAELMADHGYATAAFVNSTHLSRRYGLARGFQKFLYLREDVAETEPSTVIDHGIRWLRQHRDAPFFLFLHDYGVHSDYSSLPRYEEYFVEPTDSKADGTTLQMLRYRQRLVDFDDADVDHLIRLYDAGIRQLDHGIGRLLRALETEALADDTIVIVTSDHGEEFLDHGGVLHGRTHYQELLRVPMIVRGPGVPAGERVDEMVSLLDLTPTLLALVGAPTPDNLDGMDLSPLWLRDEPDFPPRLLFAEADHNNDRNDVMRAVRNERFTLHFNGLSNEWTLFDLERDPREQTDVLAEEPAMADLLRGRLEEFMTIGISGEPIEPLAPEEVEQLKSLGYLQ